MIDLQLVVNPSRRCETKLFKINGIEANTADFGKSSDKYYNKKNNGCACNRFNYLSIPTDAVLLKYSITFVEYKKICKELAGALRVGSCAICIKPKKVKKAKKVVKQSRKVASGVWVEEYYDYPSAKHKRRIS